MKKQISSHPCSLLLFLSLWSMLAIAACFLPACGKSVAPKSAAPGSASPSSVLSFEDFVATEASGTLHPAPNAPSASAPTPACDDKCTKQRQEFRYVVYVGKQIYAYWDIKKAETRTDYDALARTLEQSIVTGTSMTQYFLVLRRWAAAFHDGHVNAMFKEDDTDYEVYTAPLRLEVLAPATDNELVIVSQLNAADGFDPDQLGLQVGDQITAIDGKPIRQVLDEAEKLTSGSTARMRRADSARRLVDALGSERGALPLTLSVQSPQGGATHDVTLYRTAELSVPPGEASDAADETGAGFFRAMVLPGSIGYLRMDSFTGTQDVLLINEAMNLLAGTHGLLIDVRRNGGGDQSGNALLARLATSAITRYRTSPRMADFTIAQRPEYFNLSWTQGAPFADWRNERVEAAKPEDRYIDKPVALLTGTDCFSACDTFTSALKTNHLATILGEPTGGGSGTPLVFKLPISHLSFRYSVVRGQTADGQLIEGVGTQPDQVIERSQAERISGHDQQLLSALAVLGHQIQERTAPLQPAAPPHAGPAQTSSATETLLNQAMRSLGPVWAQDSALSPSRALDRKLRRLSAFDGRD